MSTSFDARLLNLANSLSDSQKTELLRYLEKLVGQAGFRIYPSILLIPKELSMAEDSQLFRYSPSDDKYIPSKSKVVVRAAQIAGVGFGRYVLQEKDKLFLVKRGNKRIVLQDVREFNLLPNGYYFVIFKDKKSPDEQRRELMNSQFRRVTVFDGEFSYLCSSERYLVLERKKNQIDVSLDIYNMKNKTWKVIETSRSFNDAVVMGEFLVVSSVTGHLKNVIAIDITKLPERIAGNSDEFQGMSKSLLQSRALFYFTKVTDKLILVLEQLKSAVLYRFNGLETAEPRKTMTKIQELKGTTASRICDNLFIFRDSLEVWRVKGERAYLLETFEPKDMYSEFLYPTREEVREISKTFKMPIPLEIADIVIEFCVEKI
jgi:hypothetical protein